MKKIIVILLLFTSCENKREYTSISTKKADSALQNSMRLNDSSLNLLDLADKKTEVVVMQVMTKVNRLENSNISLKKEIQGLKEVSKMTKTVIIRDTVFITEKKNFWGKTKKTIDSSQSQSETVVQDSIQNKL